NVHPHFVKAANVAVTLPNEKRMCARNVLVGACHQPGLAFLIICADRSAVRVVIIWLATALGIAFGGAQYTCTRSTSAPLRVNPTLNGNPVRIGEFVPPCKGRNHTIVVYRHACLLCWAAVRPREELLLEETVTYPARLIDFDGGTNQG